MDNNNKSFWVELENRFSWSLLSLSFSLFLFLSLFLSLSFPSLFSFLLPSSLRIYDTAEVVLISLLECHSMGQLKCLASSHLLPFSSFFPFLLSFLFFFLSFSSFFPFLLSPFFSFLFFLLFLLC